MQTLDYAVLVEPLPQLEGGGFVATVPDLPGCMSDGDTPEEALANVRDAIAAWIDEARAVGRVGASTLTAFHGSGIMFKRRIPFAVSCHDLRRRSLLWVLSMPVGYAAACATMVAGALLVISLGAPGRARWLPILAGGVRAPSLFGAVMPAYAHRHGVGGTGCCPSNDRFSSCPRRWAWLRHCRRPRGGGRSGIRQTGDRPNIPAPRTSPCSSPSARWRGWSIGSSPAAASPDPSAAPPGSG